MCVFLLLLLLLPEIDYRCSATSWFRQLFALPHTIWINLLLHTAISPPHFPAAFCSPTAMAACLTALPDQTRILRSLAQCGPSRKRPQLALSCIFLMRSAHVRRVRNHCRRTVCVRVPVAHGHPHSGDVSCWPRRGSENGVRREHKRMCARLSFHALNAPILPPLCTAVRVVFARVCIRLAAYVCSVQCVQEPHDVDAPHTRRAICYAHIRYISMGWEEVSSLLAVKQSKPDFGFCACV